MRQMDFPAMAMNGEDVIVGPSISQQKEVLSASEGRVRLGVLLLYK